MPVHSCHEAEFPEHADNQQVPTRIQVHRSGEVGNPVRRAVEGLIIPLTSDSPAL